MEQVVTSPNGIRIKLADNSLSLSTLGLQVSTTYKSELQQIKTDTEPFKTQAQTAKTQAETAKTQADAAKTQAEAAKTTATSQASTATAISRPGGTAGWLWNFRLDDVGPDRYHYLGDPQLGRHNYLTLRHTTDLRVSV